jgi:glutathione S-transferase
MSPPKPVILYAALPSGNSQKARSLAGRMRLTLTHTAACLCVAQAILMCRLLGLPFELRPPNGLIGADAETKQTPFLRLNPLGQVPVLVDPNAM